jgi:hypothetical protein
MVFPLSLVLAGIGTEKIAYFFRLEEGKKLLFAALGTFAIGAYSLILSFPFYESYASSLLPLRYSTDLKDMGSGSYEAAEFLNSLPGAENISIWTDKTGVCYFFRGNCYTSFSVGELTAANLDYLVLSSGRESRVANSLKIMKIKKDSPFYFYKYYDESNPSFHKIEINGRPNQFVKVIKISNNHQ